MTLLQIRDEIHRNARNHGWWETERPDGELMLLVITEVAELFEAFRRGRLLAETDKPIKFSVLDAATGDPIEQHMTNLEEETADIAIRLLDYCGRHGIEPTSIELAPYGHGPLASVCMEIVNLVNALACSLTASSRIPRIVGTTLGWCEVLLRIGGSQRSLWDCVMAKHEYNVGRPYRHGGSQA